MGGGIGLPITAEDTSIFNDFQILGISENVCKGISNGLFIKHKISYPVIHNKTKYIRLFIRRKI